MGSTHLIITGSGAMINILLLLLIQLDGVCKRDEKSLSLGVAHTVTERCLVSVISTCGSNVTVRGLAPAGHWGQTVLDGRHSSVHVPCDLDTGRHKTAIVYVQLCPLVFLMGKIHLDQ